MNKQTIIIFLTLLVAMTAAAQEKKDSIYLNGLVADGFTKAAVPDVLVTLMRQDSTVIDTARVWKGSGYTWGIGRSAETSGYYFNIKREPAQYILRFDHPNYETAYADVSIRHVSRRQRMVEGPKVYLKKTMGAHHFEGGSVGEVVVKATKVKMVWKGDTLVYNADAFNVPEGSMLDGLIKQLPGVELKENGEIFVNGKKIENLTLNGADFFKGKNKIMLENLPHFTVKNVEVYNKQTPENKYLGINDEDKKEYTMDVVLKREYSIGGSANIEAGAGPSEGGDWRYKLKAFGMRYSDHTRAVLFGGTNNINQTAEYDTDNEQYKDRSHQAGDRHFRQVGGMFTYLGPENKVNNATEIDVSWQDDKGDTRRNTENYLTDGSSTFGLSESHNRSRPVNVGLRNTLQLQGPLYVYSQASVTYNRRRYDSEGWDLSAADALYSDSINSSRYRSESRSHSLSGYGYADIGRRLPSGDSFQFSLNGNFSRQMSPETKSENHYMYYRLDKRDDRLRLTRTPSYSYSYTPRLGYRYVLKDWSFSPFYGINVSRSHNERRELLHDSIDYVLDQQNSYDTDTRRLIHRTGMTVSYSHQTKEGGYISLYTSLTGNFERQRMSYDTQQLTRHYTQVEPYLYLSYHSKGGKKRLYANYQMYQSTPSVTDLIGRPQTSDPLNIYLSNPDLSQSTRHNWRIEYSVRRDSIDQTIRMEWNTGLTRNDISRGYTYDTTTGVSTFRPQNIKGGNWNTALTLVWNRALDKKKLWSIGNELRADYRRSTSFAAPLLTSQASGGSTAGGSGQAAADDRLSRVDNLLLRYKPNVRFQKDNLTLRLKGELAYRNIHRNITLGQQPTDLWDFSYGLYASYKLPWDLTVDTDLTMHQRRGYADAEMNDSRLYWDATLTKSLGKGRWVMKLRGYDLLGQVSNLRYSINAQGRTETWNNVLKRYVMLTVSYRFTQKPKKSGK